MTTLGKFYGIGVGPGPAGLIPVAALAALQQADLIYLPRARSSEVSVARQCLAGLAIPDEKFREVEFNMDPDRSVLGEHYAQLAQDVASPLRQGKNVAYLTIGDSMTYSTYGYLLAALVEIEPTLEHHTFPGVTSFAATASALSWPLGEGKERILILPCPDDPSALRADIESHDIVVLMKIGARLPMVLQLLHGMGIAQHCAFARRIGLPGEVLCDDVSTLNADEASGYLATMLIRRTAREKRHA
ncbi:precorrin-2 C(20)-methyltransferase [Andreprevotia chitinilytica]|uniref:precorrin-2 C(20)-methyltransferase n=1 Tax=Andreprevotia chitinilytica TaxID=396808 RepID=UPI000557C6EE|nr:precorrin-2 C(20)-methyltransferase [Andreprevotia chitinilytica]